MVVAMQGNKATIRAIQLYLILAKIFPVNSPKLSQSPASHLEDYGNAKLSIVWQKNTSQELMDPLSIISSSITLLGASISASEVIISFVSGIRNLPAELQATTIDVTEFRAVLVELEASTRLEDLLLRSLPENGSGNLLAIAERLPAASQEAQSHIVSCNLKLTEIETVVRNISASEFLGKLKFLERKKLQLLRQELRDTKLSLSAHFSVKSGRLSLQSLVSLQHISGFLIQASRDRERQSNILREIHQYMRQSQSQVDEERRINNLIEALNNNNRENLHIGPLVRVDPQEAEDANDAADAADHHSRLTILPAPPADGASRPEDLTEMAAQTSNPSSTYYNSVFKLDINRFRKHACQAFCSCACHRRQRRTKHGPFGSFAIGYSNLPFYKVRCTEDSCTNRGKFSATVTYFFPTWIFLRVISLIFVTSIFGDPFVGIKVRPTTTIFSIFRYSQRGDLDGLKRLLERREVHPSVSFWGGWTALHYAISTGQSAVCRLLLSQTADPMIEDGHNSISALEWAWQKILGKSFEPARLLEFQSVFTDRECLEEMGFTRLQKLVLELERGDLATEIANMDADTINTADFGGRTALSWAAQRGDLQNVTLLLSHGADPNIVTPKGMSPLHYAAEAMNSSCIQPLLVHGADVHATDHDLARHTSLHLACSHHNSTAYLAPLLTAGIDIDARTAYSFTALIATICKNYFHNVAFLLAHGADINGRGQYGKTPVMYAIEYNAYQCLRLLLAQGADCTLECENGPTIAHFAARHADLQTLTILNEVRLPYLGLDRLEMEDAALEILIPDVVTKRMAEGEGGLGVEFETAFEVFMEGLLDPDEVEERDRVVEVWEDAVEELAVEDLVVEELAAVELAMEDLVVEELAVEELAVEELAVEELAAVELAVEELVVEELAAMELAAVELAVEELAVGELAVEELVMEELVVEELAAVELVV